MYILTLTTETVLFIYILLHIKHMPISDFGSMLSKVNFLEYNVSTLNLSKFVFSIVISFKTLIF